MPSVVLTDADQFPLYEVSMRRLADAGARLIEVPGHDRDEIVAVVNREQADAILVYHARIDAPLLDRIQSLRVIGRCGTGYDKIDVGAARARGAEVVYVPGYGSDTVADHTVALILACCRSVASGSAALRAGCWPGYPQLGPLHKLRGRVLGLVGFGRIARAVAERAAGFGMVLTAHDPAVNDATIAATGVRPVDFGALLRGSHVISIHVPLSAATKGLFDQAAFAAMQPGTVLVNTSRGEVVDEDALLRTLASGSLAAVGLDVFAEEPLPGGHPLRTDPRVVATPHSAAYSEEALEEVGDRAVADVLRLLAGQQAHNLVPST